MYKNAESNPQQILGMVGKDPTYYRNNKKKE